MSRGDHEAVLETVLGMAAQLGPVGQAELARRLRAELTPTATAEERRIAELSELAGIVREFGVLVTRLAPGVSLPELPAALDPRQEQPVELDADTDFRAHNPHRPGSPDHDAFKPRPAGRRRRAASITGGLPVQDRRVVCPSRYDKLRSPSAPSSEALARRYGSWVRACRAADGLLADGRYTGTGRPWATPPRGSGPALRYTDADVLDAIRACATDLLTRPSCHQYLCWRAGVLRTARFRRLPSHEVIRRRFGGYRQALAAAAISDEEIANARAESARLVTAELHSSPRARIAAMASELATELGLDAELIARLEQDGCGELLFQDAVTVARALGGSLDWLAERTPTIGTPPRPSVRIDGDRIRHQRCEVGLSDAVVRDRVGLPLGAWRQLLNGTYAQRTHA